MSLVLQYRSRPEEQPVRLRLDEMYTLTELDALLQDALDTSVSIGLLLDSGEVFDLDPHLLCAVGIYQLPDSHD